MNTSNLLSIGGMAFGAFFIVAGICNGCVEGFGWGQYVVIGIATLVAGLCTYGLIKENKKGDN